MASAAPAKPETELATAPKNEKVTTRVLAQINTLMERGQLQLPADYSVGNALNSAWLNLQTVENRDGKKVIENGRINTAVVTEASVANALHDMCIQGMSVAKVQGYFIVYGNVLTWQRSYFGDECLAMRVRPDIEVYRAVVYKGDEFEYELIRGRLIITKHKPKLDNQKPENIIAAYCGIFEMHTSQDLGAELMTYDRIKKSWSMSKTYKSDGNGPHNRFPDQMCLRTVVRLRTKPIIRSSTDVLLMEALRRQNDDSILAETNEEEELHGNGDTVDVAPPALAANNAAERVVDQKTGEVSEPASAAEAGAAQEEALPY